MSRRRILRLSFAALIVCVAVGAYIWASWSQGRFDLWRLIGALIVAALWGGVAFLLDWVLSRPAPEQDGDDGDW